MEIISRQFLQTFFCLCFRSLIKWYWNAAFFLCLFVSLSLICFNIFRAEVLKRPYFHSGVMGVICGLSSVYPASSFHVSLTFSPTLFTSSAAREQSGNWNRSTASSYGLRQQDEEPLCAHGDSIIINETVSRAASKWNKLQKLFCLVSCEFLHLQLVYNNDLCSTFSEMWSEGWIHFPRINTCNDLKDLQRVCSCYCHFYFS